MPRYGTGPACSSVAADRTGARLSVRSSTHSHVPRRCGDGSSVQRVMPALRKKVAGVSPGPGADVAKSVPRGGCEAQTFVGLLGLSFGRINRGRARRGPCRVVHAACVAPCLPYLHVESEDVAGVAALLAQLLHAIVLGLNPTVQHDSRVDAGEKLCPRTHTRSALRRIVCAGRVEGRKTYSARCMLCFVLSLPLRGIEAPSCAADTPLPHLHRDWALPCPHLHRDWGSPPPTSAPGFGCNVR